MLFKKPMDDKQRPMQTPQTRAAKCQSLPEILRLLCLNTALFFLLHILMANRKGRKPRVSPLTLRFLLHIVTFLKKHLLQKHFTITTKQVSLHTCYIMSEVHPHDALL